VKAGVWTPAPASFPTEATGTNFWIDVEFDRMPPVRGEQ
jgi:hypothetical protein